MKIRKDLQLLLVFLGLIICPAALPAADREDPAFLPLQPAIAGQGGACLAAARGYESLFYNPAGFSGPDGEFTLLDAAIWIKGDPSSFLEAWNSGGSAGLEDFVAREATSGGVGYGFSTGIGYVGKGLGLGAVFSVDSTVCGEELASAKGSIDATLALVAGIAFPVELGGIKASFGGDLRPLFRVRAPLDAMLAFEVLNALRNGNDVLRALNDVEALHGYGFAVDLGGRIEAGPFSFAAVLNDFLGTRIYYSQHKVESIVETVSSTLAFPQGGNVSDVYRIPMDLNLGMAFHPDLGSLKAWIDPILAADLRGLFTVPSEGGSPWSMLHLGVQVTFLSFLNLRAGLNQGYPSFGFGLELPFLELNWALTTMESGDSLWDSPLPVMAVEAAIRF